MYVGDLTIIIIYDRILATWPLRNMRSTKKTNSSFFDRLQGGVAQVRECPMCGKSYSEQSVDVLFEEHGVHLVHITCVSCHSKILNIVTISQMGVSSVGLFTDLSADDVVTFYEKEPISEDDVLSFHNAVNIHSKKLSHLLSK